MVLLNGVSESAEDYLEAIFRLSQGGNSVRAVDIASERNYSKPSVSVAMKNLREGGYVDMDSSGHIVLTKSGKEIAERVYLRHTLIAEWLMVLGVDEKTAENDACKMEHGMSDATYIAMKKHIEEWKNHVCE